jgi:hypothetical protein
MKKMLYIEKNYNSKYNFNEVFAFIDELNQIYSKRLFVFNVKDFDVEINGNTFQINKRYKKSERIFHPVISGNVRQERMGNSLEIKVRPDHSSIAILLFYVCLSILFFISGISVNTPFTGLGLMIVILLAGLINFYSVKNRINNVLEWVKYELKLSEIHS